MSSGLAPYNFTITDQSTVFQYSPSRDGPIATSWNVTYAGSQDSSLVPGSSVGSGASSHRTSLVGASVRLDWTGTGIYLYGDAFNSAYTIELNGIKTNGAMSVPGLLFSSSKLDYGLQTLVLRAEQGMVSISNATMTAGVGEIGTTVQNRTIATGNLDDMTRNNFVHTSDWQSINGIYGDNDSQYARIATNTAGGTVSFPLTNASAFYIRGHVNYDHGAFSVTVTSPSSQFNPQVGHYNGSSQWIGLNVIKHMSTGLNRSQTYHVDVKNDEGKWFDMSEVVIFDALSSSSSSLPELDSGSHHLGNGAIAGIAVGVTFSVALLVGVILLLFVRMRRLLRTGQPIKLTSKKGSFDVEGADVSHVTPFVSQRPSTILSHNPSNYADSNPESISAHQDPFVDPGVSSQTKFRSKGAAKPSRTTGALPSSTSPSDGHALTEEQTKLVESLLQQNIPASTVAGVIQGMLTSDRQSGSNLSNAGAAIGSPGLEAPPSYEKVNS